MNMNYVVKLEDQQEYGLLNKKEQKLSQIQLQLQQDYLNQMKLQYRSDDQNALIDSKYQNNNNNNVNRKKYQSENKLMSELKKVQHNTQQYFNNKVNKYFNNRQQCDCQMNLKSEESCERSLRWFNKKYDKKEHHYLLKKYQELKESVKQMQEQKPVFFNDYYNNKFDYHKQIEKDLLRTYPDHDYFKKGAKGINQLRSLLMCFSIYDPQIGYVQGMNYIAAALLYHCQEYIAFWLLVAIFEQFELRDVYLPSLPGLSKHSQIISYLLLDNLPDIHKHLIQLNITIEMFTSSWIISFLGTILPLNIMGIFFDKALEEGWLFIYKIILSYFINFQKKIIQSDMEELIILLTQNRFSKQKINQENQVNWFQIINITKTVQIDKNFIDNMLVHFDHEKKQFMINF